MTRGVASVMRRTICCTVGLVVVLMIGGPGLSANGSPARSCTAAQKTHRQRELAAYLKRMKSLRTTYFRLHSSAKARRAFVTKQRRQLSRLRAAASCTVPVATAPAPTPPAPAPPPPPPVSVLYEFGAEVSSADQAWPKDVVDYAGSTLQALTGVTMEPFRVFVYASPDGLAAAFQKQAGLDPSAVPVKSNQYASGNVAAEAGYHGVFVYMGNFSWSSGDQLSRQKILAHEMFHLIEEQLEHDPSNCLEHLRIKFARVAQRGSLRVQPRRWATASRHSAAYSTSQASSGAILQVACAARR